MALLFVLAALLLQQGRVPDAFLAMQQARNDISSSHLVVQFTDHQDVHHVGVKTVKHIYRSAANGDYILENRGDEEGWTRRDCDGKYSTKRPIVQCKNADGYWRGWYKDLCLDWHRQCPGDDGWGAPLDFIRLGLSPIWTQFASDKSVLETIQADSLTWQQERRGGILEITLLADEAYFKWYVNPEAGWAVERAEAGVGTPGDLPPFYECRSRLRQWGEIWFPEVTTYFQHGEPYWTFVVEQAEFNRPEHPRKFSPADIGAEVGFNITPRDSKFTQHLMWDGEKPIALVDFHRLVRERKLKVGPTIKARRRGEHSPHMTQEQIRSWEADMARARLKASVKQHRSWWERYVERFTKRYQLNDEQAQRARLVLRDCQDKAQDYLARQEAQFKELSERLAKASHDPASEDELPKLATELERLTGVVDEIFEQQLKPRLEKIPTRAQREAAKQAASTRPARRKPDSQRPAKP